jgi:DNA-binding LytR/AlgR family response regulator
MLARVRRPLAPVELILLTSAVAAAVATYCVGYAALAGRSESAVDSLVWALVNVAPWVPALELAKRAKGAARILGALAFGFGTSLALGLLSNPQAAAGFEAWRRLPALGGVALLALALKWSQASAERAAEPLPLLPRQIDWVQAAGNYIELKAGDRTIVHRASIGAAERDLAAHGFVRIHRSTLVRRDRIARVRPADVVLIDGTHLKVGKRFRSHLTN